MEYLREIGVGGSSPTRAVVFAERLATLHWLQMNLPKHLKLKAQNIAVLHGGLSDVEQQGIIESFKLEDSPIRVLVAGDMASEGVNLHTQCHHLVHYDIPWSLIRIEQRNGRIDRYGQKHRPQIASLILRPSHENFSGDLRILSKLVDRADHANRALGGVAGVMGGYSVSKEENEIEKVLAGRRDLDDALADDEQVREQTPLPHSTGTTSSITRPKTERQRQATPPRCSPAELTAPGNTLESPRDTACSTGMQTSSNMPFIWPSSSRRQRRHGAVSPGTASASAL